MNLLHFTVFAQMLCDNSLQLKYPDIFRENVKHDLKFSMFSATYLTIC